MSTIDRREFMARAAAVVGTALTGDAALVYASASQPASAPSILRVSDTVTLGRTGIQTSRLAIGTGTKVSRQRELGERGILKLFRHGLDQGVRWWDVADLYGTHPLVRSTLRQIPREQVVITSKTHAKDFKTAVADVDRFREEMGTDYIDILLLHCQTEADWTTRIRGAMEGLSQAKEKGHVRAVGCSIHSLEALEAAANEPWVDVVLARINPFAKIMDVKEPGEVPKVIKVLERIAERGKGLYGMKIIGEGQLAGQQIDDSLRLALSLRCLNGFVIGFRAPEEIDDIIRRVERVQRKA